MKAHPTNVRGGYMGIGIWHREELKCRSIISAAAGWYIETKY
jgi:hypothetical protein